MITWVETCHGSKDKAVVQTPLGLLSLQSQGEVLLNADWLVVKDIALQFPATSFLQQVVVQLDGFWQNSRYDFVIKVLKKGTSFRLNVWQALCQIKAGKVITYAELAKVLATGPRAIGGACKHNPFPVFVPCHRIISASGIGGYAGAIDGPLVSIKEGLLAHEKSIPSSL
ncbi:MAG: methylated-DNA--[protein]-cysteine S-methyltransferase [Methylococcaceae bacterium]